MKKILLTLFLLLLSTFIGCQKPDTQKSISSNSTKESAETPTFKTFCEDKKTEYPKMIKKENLSEEEKKTNEKNFDTNYEKRGKLIDKPVLELFLLLDDKKSLEENGDTLYTIGLNYTQKQDHEQAFKFYKCASEKYFDTNSMLKLSQFYFLGSDAFQANIKNPIPQDINKTYFWILNAIYIDLFQGGKNFIITANTIKLLDILQTDNTHTEGLDRDKTEKESADFIQMLYPEEKNLQQIMKDYYSKK